MLAISTRSLELDPHAERPDLDRLLGFDVAAHELAGPLSSAALTETAAALRQSGRTLTSLRAPCPASEAQVRRGVLRGLPPISDLDRTQRAVAVAAACHSLEWAARLEVPLVVLPATPSGAEFPAQVAGALVGTPAWAGAAGQALRRGFLAARAPRAAARIDALCFALDELLGRAGALGLELALENREQPDALLDRAELAQILERFAGAPLVTWYHAGAVWSEEYLTLDTGAEWRSAVASTLRGARVDDRSAQGVALPPGEGELDFATLGEHLPSDLPAVLDGDPSWGAERMAASIAHLRACGVGDTPPTVVEPFPIIGGS